MTWQPADPKVIAEAVKRVLAHERKEDVARDLNLTADTITKYMRLMGIEYKRPPQKELQAQKIMEHLVTAQEQKPVSAPESTQKSESGNIVLAIPDLHCPWQHPDALAFLIAIRDTYNVTKTVCLGDEIDAMGYSRYPQDPDAPNQSKELELAIEQLLPFYRAFPDMLVCESNHTIRPWKKAFEAGLPKSFLPTVARVLRAPDGWSWHNEIEIDGVRYIHGDAGSSGFTAHIQYMRKFKQSVVIGHIHSYAGVNYEGELFGVNSGCLIDAEAICFKYAKNMPIPVSLGCTIVKYGKQAQFIPMILDENRRWIGKL
jgi:hypothetical protein